MPRTELDDEGLARVTLSLVKGIGPTLLTKLLAHFGTARVCLQSSERALQAVGLSSRVVVGILEAQRDGLPPDEVALLRQPGLGFAHIEDDDYPRLLREIYDPPPLLYVRGSFTPEDEFAVAMVGSRRPTDAALERAHEIAFELAQNGATVVSGLAVGVDSASHRGALDAGGRTVAVLAGGLAELYPRENVPLAERVERSGAVITELPMSVPTIRQNFPPRNRIISGMSRATLIVQAQHRSGTLITARHANEEGREVFVVPWEESAHSAGSNALIEDGATPVESAAELLAHLRGLPKPVARAPMPKKPTTRPERIEPPAAEQTPELEGDQAVLWDALSDEPIHIDALTQVTGLKASSVGTALLLMEMKSLVRQHPGKRFSRV